MAAAAALVLRSSGGRVFDGDAIAQPEHGHIACCLILAGGVPGGRRLVAPDHRIREEGVGLGLPASIACQYFLTRTDVT
jgi:hypothetical protein